MARGAFYHYQAIAHYTDPAVRPYRQPNGDAMSDTFSYETRTDPTGAVCVVALAGSLDPEGAEQLGPALNALCDAGRQRFVLDLSRLEYVGSLGLRALLVLSSRLRPSGGVVALAAASARVEQVLDVTRLNAILRRYPTVDDAIDAVRSA